MPRKTRRMPVTAAANGCLRAHGLTPSAAVIKNHVPWTNQQHGAPGLALAFGAVVAFRIIQATMRVDMERHQAEPLKGKYRRFYGDTKYLLISQAQGRAGLLYVFHELSD